MKISKFIFALLVLIVAIVPAFPANAEGEETFTVTFTSSTGYLFYPDEAETDDSEVQITVESGHVLAEEDIPVFLTLEGGCAKLIGWSPCDPVGVVVDSDLIFETITEQWYFPVCFYDYDGSVIKDYYWVEKGSCLEPPPDPVREGYVFTGWSDDGYLNVVYDVSAYAIYSILGDVNTDEVLNTGDAVMILKYIANTEMLDKVQMRIGDFNKDNEVNTGDATAILLSIVG
ncbi:MAG: hypothetical protein GX802_07345 [Clostridiales bacterium]|nr:hypothetical protein [Clostridiales bacterium]